VLLSAKQIPARFRQRHVFPPWCPAKTPNIAKALPE
jgi:hypothetical protein